MVSRFSPRRVVRELRRRRVFNTVALYVVGAWVALQVADLAFPGLEIPENAIRYVWMGAFVLFPLVLIFGWRYDISPEGIKRTPSADAVEDADTSLQRLDHGIIGILSSIVVVVIAVTGVRISQVEPIATTTTLENSIAVLPFQVCEDMAREQKLAGGLTMEVINRLAERGKLKVIAHASSYMMAGFGLQKQQIAKPLGVQYLLSGKVCRYEDELTLAAELFDERGFVVWADSYIQKVNQWDQITGRLATLVASGVAAELGDVAQSSPEAPVNRRAYEQLLIGTQYWDNGDKEQARIAFVHALEYEPEYAEALFYLALQDTEGFLDEGREKSIAEARPRIEEALSMARNQLEQNDRSAYAHYMVARLNRVLVSWDEELAFRWNHASGLDVEEVARLKEEIKAGYAESERHFRSAISFNPSLTNAYTWLADVIENQGIERRTEALEILEDGQVRDPFNLSYNSRIAKRWAGRGRYRQAIELLERFKDLPEIPSGVWWWQLELMQIQGYWDEKCETLVEMLSNHPEAFDDWGNRWQAWWYVSSLANMGLYEEAEAWKLRIENMPMWNWSRNYGLVNYLWATGQENELPKDNSAEYFARVGEYQRAIELLETTRHERKLWHERAPRDDLLLAGAYQKAGRDDEAESLLESVAVDLEAEFASGIRHQETLYNLSETYAFQGRDDDAMDMLRKAYDYHFLTDCSDMVDDLTPWGRFEKDPRWISLCKRMQADLELQTERVRAKLAEHDPDELLAPLMTLAQADTGGE